MEKYNSQYPSDYYELGEKYIFRKNQYAGSGRLATNDEKKKFAGAFSNVKGSYEYDPNKKIAKLEGVIINKDKDSITVMFGNGYVFKYKVDAEKYSWSDVYDIWNDEVINFTDDVNKVSKPSNRLVEDNSIKSSKLVEDKKRSSALIEESRSARLVEEPEKESHSTRLVEEPRSTKLVEEPHSARLVEEPRSTKLVEEPRSARLVEDD